MCPSGEVCSTTTTGLFFAGTFDAGDGWSHVGSVVVGGSENVHLFAGADRDTATPFTSSVRVVSDTPNVLAVDRAASGTITLRGVSEGSAFLRVLESDTGHLVDRLGVEVIALDGPDVIAPSLDVLATDSPGLLAAHYVGPLALLAGTRPELAISLDGGVTDCGVDVGLVVTDAGGTTLVSGASAPYRFTVSPSGASIDLAIHVAGTDAHRSVPVVAAIDGVRTALHVHAGITGATHATTVCAVATAGGVPVAGAALPRFDTTSGATITTRDATSCVGVMVDVGVRATITASIGAHSASIDVVGQ